MSQEGTDAWVIDTTAVFPAGNVQQLYPVWATPGVAKAGSLNGQLLRKTSEGAVHSIQVKTDGVNGGTLELYDIDGETWGADVSSGTTITNAQLTAALAVNQAKLIYSISFAGTVGSLPSSGATIVGRGFLHGLAARFSNGVDPGTPAAGVVTLNLVVSSGQRKVESRGGY